MRLRRKLSEYSARDLASVVLPMVLVLVLGFWLASRYVKPAPPSYLVISTGAEGGAYQWYASHYKTLLAKNGIQLRELPSEGSVENLKRLKDRSQDVDVGLVQGGTGQGMEEDGLVSLGSIAPEPLWVFYRSGRIFDKLTQLKGLRLALGPEGSGARQLAVQLLEANGITTSDARFLPVGGLKAVEALQKGEVDVVFVVGAARSAAVWSLLYSPGVKLMSFERAEAYTRRFDFLSKVVLPAGGIDLARDVPAQDVTLVAATATLVARRETHPALLNLLLQAASTVHGKPGLFKEAHAYPNANPVDFPLAKEAEHYYKSGPPLLQRYLPFWAATLIDRMMVMLIPLVALMLPLAKVAPGIYTWRVRSRIFRYYGELKFLEADMQRNFPAHTPEEWRAELERLEVMVRDLHTPQAFMDQLYTLRQHIEMVRGILARKTAERSPLP